MIISTDSTFVPPALGNGDNRDNETFKSIHDSNGAWDHAIVGFDPGTKEANITPRPGEGE
ncbi:hypothetical protein PAAG_11348 [Paracoccidioides lutzii Pb01]|uniref:Uncharacterized protein n=1 Tax=Paracoccidioides lutzii (strain ATCC MYA-826 / Pb01) TaxID=502779 RepID=A0A0A2V758_PARBA|nr:hypothetical protein PAAG_11348 [Paracoccidioides lutzii Pb01]KGQ01955.1 hypothetical protein PAAG_11348 [Paracoccidioides lutzii Pb01]